MYGPAMAPRSQLSAAAFSALLKRVRAEVDARLASLFHRKLAGCRTLGDGTAAMLRATRDLTMRGGKRFRPALLCAAYRAVDARAPLGVAYDAGVALELLQSYFLIHDDWMDGDAVRRGGPSVHTVIGDASAVLAGDHAAALALGVLTETRARPERLSAALSLFASVQEDTILGQQMDVTGSGDVERMHDLKTGSYTVRGPILLGATLAGADARTLRALARFARPLGIAFQLRDDLLGTFGNAKDTGKPVGSDVRSGKRTSLMVEALARAGAADRRTLETTLGRREAGRSEIAEVAAICERTGAHALVVARLYALVARARRTLSRIELAATGRGELDGAATALTSRTK
jgi:geranylgeranyl diphosphate synthase type I